MHAKEHHATLYCVHLSQYCYKPVFAPADYSACVVYTKTIIHLSVGESGEFVLFSRRGCSKTTIFTCVVSASLS